MGFYYRQPLLVEPPHWKDADQERNYSLKLGNSFLSWLLGYYLPVRGSVRDSALSYTHAFESTCALSFSDVWWMGREPVVWFQVPMIRVGGIECDGGRLLVNLGATWYCCCCLIWCCWGCERETGFFAFLLMVCEKWLIMMLVIQLSTCRISCILWATSSGRDKIGRDGSEFRFFRSFMKRQCVKLSRVRLCLGLRVAQARCCFGWCAVLFMLFLAVLQNDALGDECSEDGDVADE